MNKQDTASATTMHQRWLLPLTDNLALLAGLMATTGLPPFKGTGLLVPLALALLLRVLLTAPRPVFTTWLFSLAHQTSLLYWLFFLEPAASIPSRWLVPVQAILTILYVSAFYVFFGLAFRFVRNRLGTTAAVALSPVLWTAMEAWRGAGEMGFPWCLVGTAWLETPLRSLYATSGEIGLSAATSLTAAALVALLLRNGRDGALQLDPAWRVAIPVAAVLLWIGLAAGAGWRATEPDDAGDEIRREPIRVAAVQANVALKDKWQRAKIDSTIVPYTELTAAAAAAGAEFIVWAETAIPAYVRIREPKLLVWLRQTARDNGVFLYVGFPDAELRSDGKPVRYNASGLLGPDGMILGRYKKHHLLPVGERMPFSRYLPFLAKVDMGQAEWAPGELPCPLVMPTDQGDLPFSGLICFESIFSDLARQAVICGARILVNITNDGWFGQTAGPRQHASLARVRAIECGVPLIRCANNGISFVLDDKGRFLASAGLGQRGFIVADVTPTRGGTLFIRAGARPLVAFLAAWTLLTLAYIRGKSS